jgi:hypothetical protein
LSSLFAGTVLEAGSNEAAQLASRAPVRAATEGSRDEKLKGNSDQEIAIRHQ